MALVQALLIIDHLRARGIVEMSIEKAALANDMLTLLSAQKGPSHTGPPRANADLQYHEAPEKSPRGSPSKVHVVCRTVERSVDYWSPVLGHRLLLGEGRGATCCQCAHLVLHGDVHGDTPGTTAHMKTFKGAIGWPEGTATQTLALRD